MTVHARTGAWRSVLRALLLTSLSARRSVPACVRSSCTQALRSTAQEMRKAAIILQFFLRTNSQCMYVTFQLCALCRACRDHPGSPYWSLLHLSYSADRPRTMRLVNVPGNRARGPAKMHVVASCLIATSCCRPLVAGCITVRHTTDLEHAIGYTSLYGTDRQLWRLWGTGTATRAAGRVMQQLVPPRGSTVRIRQGVHASQAVRVLPHAKQCIVCVWQTRASQPRQPLYNTALV